MNEHRLVMWLIRALIIIMFCVATVFWFIYERLNDRVERFHQTIEKQIREADP